MKLLRYGEPGEELPGLLDPSGRIRSLNGHCFDIAGSTLSPEGLERIRQVNPDQLEIVPHPVRLGPCVSGVGKMICVGLNYSDHAEESGMAVPDEPVIFFKATSSIVGPDDDVMIPRRSRKTDWEVELGVVIGTRASYVSEEQAMAHVAGYCIVNDLSEREFQLERGGQWVKGKSCDTFGPIGPWLVTKDDVPDPNHLRMYLEVNGQRYQDGSTANMVYKVPFLVSYLSQFMTLEPGDIISTGTPAGVGLGQTPQKYLREGDTMRLSIEGLGEQFQHVKQA